ncbi:MAG: hypothetical protein M3N32_10010 [Actinomycetota bacterium]|nr:hypothetical protein [Actinomycetota bacterium]
MAQKPDPGVTRYQTRTGQQRWRVTYDYSEGPTVRAGGPTTKRGWRLRHELTPLLYRTLRPWPVYELEQLDRRPPYSSCRNPGDG